MNHDVLAPFSASMRAALLRLQAEGGSIIRDRVERLRALGQPSDGDVVAALESVAPPLAPALLFELFEQGVINVGHLPAVLVRLWSQSGLPVAFLSNQAWLRMFEATGYIGLDGQQIDRPEGPIRLYRGSTAALRFNYSWTPDPLTAEMYAAGEWGWGGGRMPGQVWTAKVAPRRLLAKVEWVANDGEHGAEYVVNTDGLDVHEVPREERVAWATAERDAVAAEVARMGAKNDYEGDNE